MILEFDDEVRRLEGEDLHNHKELLSLIFDSNYESSWGNKYNTKKKLSASMLTQSTRMIIANILFPEYKTATTLSKRTGAAIGSLIHEALEQRARNSGSDKIKSVEDRLFYELDGYLISSQNDVIIGDESGELVLYDYKVVKQFKFKKNPTLKELEAYILQASCINYLLFRNGKKTINKSFFIEIYKDFKNNKTGIEEDENPLKSWNMIRVPVIAPLTFERYLKKKISQIEKGIDLIGNEKNPNKAINMLKMCSTEEAWVQPATYRLLKDKSSKRAMNGCSNLSLSAAKALQEKKGGIISTLKAESAVRCGYCSAFDVCGGYNSGTNK